MSFLFDLGQTVDVPGKARGGRVVARSEYENGVRTYIVSLPSGAKGVQHEQNLRPWWAEPVLCRLACRRFDNRMALIPNLRDRIEAYKTERRSAWS